MGTQSQIFVAAAVNVDMSSMSFPYKASRQATQSLMNLCATVSAALPLLFLSSGGIGNLKVS